MFLEVSRSMFKAVNVICVILLAGMYVFAYYDYLQTITQNGSVSISGSQDQPTYSNGQLGVIVTNQKISVAQ